MAEEIQSLAGLLSNHKTHIQRRYKHKRYQKNTTYIHRKIVRTGEARQPHHTHLCVHSTHTAHTAHTAHTHSAQRSCSNEEIDIFSKSLIDELNQEYRFCKCFYTLTRSFRFSSILSKDPDNQWSANYLKIIDFRKKDVKKCVKFFCDEKKLDAVRTHTRAYVQRVKPTKTNVQIVQNTLEKKIYRWVDNRKSTHKVF